MCELERLKKVWKKRGYVYFENIYDYSSKKWYYVFADFRNGDYPKYEWIEIKDESMLEGVRK